MVAKKHKSKRIEASHRYKVAKNVREHHRKSRKQERENPRRHAIPKDPGIPAQLPFREQIVSEVEQARQRVVDDRVKRREMQLKQMRSGNSSLSDLVQSAEQREVKFSSTMVDAPEFNGKDGVDLATIGKRDNSRKAYYKEFKKVIDNADVILEVLDARDPMGCRVKQIEEMIQASGGRKKVILLLNKIDLVPREVVEKWLKHLRNEYPTIAFKASTQSQRDNLGHVLHSTTKDASDRVLTGNECLGADQLMKLLKNYCRNANIKTSITVGVIGYPNVGKSSVINSLKRSRVCGVGATPGHTKALQEISLDKNIKLLDCPGIVFSMGDSAENAVEAVLRNCVKVELLDDPAAPVELILSRCSKEQMMKIYGIPTFSDTQSFLIQVARQRGRLRRGGVPDANSAAKSVLQDWNSGKIPYYTLPPTQQAAQIAAEIVPTWSSEFNMDELREGDSILEQVKERSKLSTQFVHMSPGLNEVDMDAVPDEMMDTDYIETGGSDDESADQEAMSAELVTCSSEKFLPTPASRARNFTPAVKQQVLVSSEEQLLNPQRNKALKKQAKKANQKKSAVGDSYDFSQDFVSEMSDIDE